MRPFRDIALPLSIASLVAGLIGSEPEEANACATVSRRPVTIAGEEALIVWNPETKIQHFVRTASFAGARRDFGFLVPTPGRPELEEVDADVFRKLYSIYRRPARRRRSRRPSSMGGGSGGRPVQVIEEREVAGMDAAVLRASDPAALRRWLEDNGYPADEHLDDWLEVYVVKGWYLTAFKIQAGSATAVRTRAVRMSFSAERPFYPYSEPQRRRSRGRPLRVSVVAPVRMEASVGSLDPWETVGYANHPGERLHRALDGIVPERALGAEPWLTVFDEPRSVRGTQDVFFRAAAHQAPVQSRIRTRLGVRGRSGSSMDGHRNISDDPLAGLDGL